MSKYTTEVRFICENASGFKESKGYADVDEIITNAIPSVFNFDFPVFDESYRNVICTKILRHYYTREIGFETVGLWKLKMQTKLNEVMPYFNKLYESELLKFNPLYDVDLNTTHAGDKSSELNKEENKTGLSDGNREHAEQGSVVGTYDTVEGNNASGNSTSDSSANSSSSDSNKVVRTGSENESGTNDKVVGSNYSDREDKLHYDLYSDTPQGGLTGVNQETYLTNARKITDENTKSGKNDSTESGRDERSRENTQNETGVNDSVRAENTSGSNSYEETSDKTTVGNDKRENNASATDKEVRTTMENSTGKDKFNSTESYVLHVVGKQAGVSYSKLLKEFRDTFLNIDMDVVNSVSDLFMNLW